MEYANPMPRLWMLLTVGVTLALAQLRHPETTAKLELQSNHPTRLYLYKNDRPFRLHPVDAILSLKIDLFYGDTLWRRTPNPQTLEVTHNDQSHFYLLTSKATFDLQMTGLAMLSSSMVPERQPTTWKPARSAGVPKAT